MSETTATAAPGTTALRRYRVWIVLAVLYGLFFFWYTSFGGPLTDAEIVRYEQVLQDYGQSRDEVERWREFMQSDTGDDFAMFNAMEFRAVATPVAGLETGSTGRQALARYGGPFFQLAAPDAAHPVMIGSAAAQALDLWGIEGGAVWHQGALVRYRSRRDLMNQVVTLAERAATGEDIHAYKIAGLQKTIAFPLDPWFQLGDPRLLLALLCVIAGLAWRGLGRAPG